MKSIFVLILTFLCLAVTSYCEDLGKASKLIIPKLVFRDASINEGVAFLLSKGRSLDPEKSGVNIILVPWKGMEEIKLNLNLSNVSFGERASIIGPECGRRSVAGWRSFHSSGKGLRLAAWAPAHRHDESGEAQVRENRNTRSNLG